MADPTQGGDTSPPAAPKRPVDWAALGKYGIGAGIFGSIYYLVLQGKIPVDQFMTLASGALTALGWHLATK